MIFEKTRSSTLRLALGATALTLIGSVASADQVILDDLIVDGSLCVGFDCVNGESFGFDTIRMKENNIRIKAQDTSTSASFPTNDWQLTFNDTSNGGANKFSIDDIDGGRTPFTIEAGAPSHSLYTDDGGRIGFGTNTPVVELHVKDGDTPTLRLEQDGSSGFTAQTWDVAGNETNWFVRDVTSGSDLVLRLRAGAPANSIFVDTDGDVGMGTSAPEQPLHLRRTGSGEAARILVESSSGDAILDLEANDPGKASRINFISDGSAGDPTLSMVRINTFLRFNFAAGATEFEFQDDGDLVITGALTTGGPTCGGGCDAVFDPAVYTVPSIEEHAALMWENKHLPAVGPTGPDMAIDLTERYGTLLNEIEHAHIYIEQLNAELKAQRGEIAALTALVADR